MGGSFITFWRMKQQFSGAERLVFVPFVDKKHHSVYVSRYLYKQISMKTRCFFGSPEVLTEVKRESVISLLCANVQLVSSFVLSPRQLVSSPTQKSRAEPPGTGATVEVCTFLDIADSFELFLMLSEQVVVSSSRTRQGLVIPENTEGSGASSTWADVNQLTRQVFRFYL